MYPKLNARLGAEALGTMIYMMGLINIPHPSVGQALNNSRLVVRRTHEVTNGDYDVTLLFYSCRPLRLSQSWSGLPAGCRNRFHHGTDGTSDRLPFYGDVEYRMF